MVVKARVTTVLIGKSFAMQLVNGWKKLPEQMAEVASVCKFQGG